MSPRQKWVRMMPSSAFVLLYASLARAPEFAMTLASRMAANAFSQSDLDGVQRWTRCYHELSTLYDAEQGVRSAS